MANTDGKCAGVTRYLYVVSLRIFSCVRHGIAQLATFHDGEDEDDWSRGWSHAVTKQPTTCPACGGFLTAVGLTPDERARIRDTLFDMAGLQVKKHSRSR